MDRRDRTIRGQQDEDQQMAGGYRPIKARRVTIKRA